MMNKVWVFQSNRAFTDTEKQDVSQTISQFLQSWEAHGASLTSKFQILENRFIIIEVDEEQEKATGCSIDSLTQCIRKIDAEYNLALLNRLWVSYKSSDKEIKTLPLDIFKEKLKKLELTEDTIIYNLSVSNSEEFKQKFEQPLKESWAKIYL